MPLDEPPRHGPVGLGVCAADSAWRGCELAGQSVQPTEPRAAGAGREETGRARRRAGRGCGRPGHARAATVAIRRRLMTKQTRLHSPFAFVRPRIETARKPRMCLIHP